MRGHLLVAVADATQCHAERVLTHRPHVSTERGKNELPASGMNLQLPKQFSGLTREGHNVLHFHLHSFGRNTPLRQFE